MRAIWNGKTLATSDDTVVVENNHYFPAASLDKRYFAPSERHTTCAWKGVASYYDIVVDGKTNDGAAWFYETPKEAAKQITNRVAFWKGVEVVE